MVCFAPCNSGVINAATIATLSAQAGVTLALGAGAMRANLHKSRFSATSVYANDLILVTPTAGVSQLGQRNITYQISNLSDYVTGVILVGQWPALIACDASTQVGQSAGVVKQYPVLGASPLIRCCAEQTFFEQFADAGVATLADAL